ncbi:macrophage mannose receptor 1-like [Gigantopelta aegis]|uniref:macrophage mannose receptor 1-like n=1 Tax=Gigantopelta aegis TaxID=1735272 RepID=UPI001B888C37|nr:macrophage mannose receptor 1-like [Gigantopelta aegis]
MQGAKVRCTLLLEFVMCCISITLSCNEDFKQSRWIRNVSFDDVAIADNVISSLSDVTTQLACAWECQQKRNCVSFSYNDDHTCRLHSLKFANNSSYLPSSGWRYYYLNPGHCPVEDGYILIDKLNLCFKVSTTMKLFDEARDICSESGARLIVLDTEEKNTAVSSYIRENIGVHVYFIGLTDKVTEGEYVWEDGTIAGFMNWDIYEPSNIEGVEDCVLLIPEQGKWNDCTCSAWSEYICETQP